MVMTTMPIKCLFFFRIVVKHFFMLSMLSCLSFKSYAGNEHHSSKDFIASFIKNYELSPEGRYVHEYHQFILEEAAKSFDLLEKHLTNNNFSLSGRYVILGYEEAAVPRYYTNYKQDKIDDEASIRVSGGWSLTNHNRFGFMTGFLFKDINKLVQQQIFHHIDADKIPIFDDRAVLFQEHAFGKAYDLLLHVYHEIMDCIGQEDKKKTLETLCRFWRVLYEDALTMSNKQVAGTQDILFSIAMAQYVLGSPLPLNQFFIGPDLTYPIEIFEKQKKEATRHAQAFVRTFVEKLVPINNAKTVYVFCSFVDGVGKSTMLGNIKNWLKHGDKINDFEHVDNSSSQFAEIFSINNKVYIADLPAQMSHFTYKPDGHVYVDARTIYTKNDLAPVLAFVGKQRDQIEKNYQQLLAETKKIIEQDGYFADSFEQEKDPTRVFIKNLFLLKREHDNKWLPVTYEGRHYVVNYSSSEYLRCLTTLAKVKSEGLKNIESEQMLFFDGLRFPFPYHLFLDNLTQQLKAREIQEVVFVDFMSMYPRSSRENIRVNYLLQQLALLYENFDPHDSMYRYFSSGEELLSCLQNDHQKKRFFASLKSEVLTRLILYEMICAQDEYTNPIDTISLQQLTQSMQQRLGDLFDDSTYLDQCLQKKIDYEISYLQRVYGSTKTFVNIQSFSFEQAHRLHEALQTFFVESLDHERLSAVWRRQASDVMHVNFSFHTDYRGEGLHAFLRSLRAHWYTAITNLLWAQRSSATQWRLHDEPFGLTPCFLEKDDNDHYHFLKKDHQVWTGQDRGIARNDVMMTARFQLSDKPKFVSFGDRIYRTNGDSLSTATRLYAFGHESMRLGEDQYYTYFPSISRVVQEFQREYGVTTVMSTTQVVDHLKKSPAWIQEQKNQRLLAQQNGVNHKPIAVMCYGNEQLSSNKTYYAGTMEKPFFVASDEFREAAQLVVRMLATIEMIVKDPDADIVVRYKNKEDFKAAIWLLEKITLPKYFKLVFLRDLFEDYNAVEPYPSWHYWDEK